MIKAFPLLLLVAFVAANTPLQHLSLLNDIFSGSFFSKESILGQQDDSSIEFVHQNKNVNKKGDIMDQMKHVFNLVAKPESYR